MLPLDIPPGTTVETLITRAIPELHARLVGSAMSGALSEERFVVNVQIGDRANWALHIRGPAMLVGEGHESNPTLWMYASEDSAARFLEDALGPRRLLPPAPARAAHGGDVVTLSDPRVVRRVAMANGRVELAVIDEAGGRISVVFGFGNAARRPIRPDRPDTVVEAQLPALQRVLRGEQGPEEALASGDVSVRGSRLLAVQLALAIAPFRRDVSGVHRSERR